MFCFGFLGLLFCCLSVVCTCGELYTCQTYGKGSYVINSDQNFSTDYSKLPLFRENDEIFYEMEILPLPVSKNGINGFPVKINHYIDDDENDGDYEEVRFNASIHLDLEFPSDISLFPNFNRVYLDEYGYYGDSEFGLSGESFQILSKEGVEEIHKIVMKNKKYAHRNFRNYELRGLYYLSPFIRDFMTNKELLNHFSHIIGEPVIPHLLYMDAPSVNFGEISDPVSVNVDHWHFDSVSYVCVILISNITDMIGGDLQVIIENNKWTGIEKLISSQNGDRYDINKKTIRYDDSGKCVLIQGSEILHHVTKVIQAYEERISLVMAFQPSNAFVSDKTVLNTWQKFDSVVETANYEFFRMQSWRLSHNLEYYAKNIEFTKDGTLLADILIGIRHELDRTIELLNGEIQDNIGFYNETFKQYQF